MRISKAKIINSSFVILLLSATVIFSLAATKNFNQANGAASAQTQQTSILKTISTKDALNLLARNKNNPDFMVLDVRTPEEYTGGHLEHAVNIDYYSSNYRSVLGELDKAKTYLIYCRSGNRSGKSLSIMEELGFKRVYDIAGGLVQWKREAYPVVQ